MLCDLPNFLEVLLNALSVVFRSESYGSWVELRCVKYFDFSTIFALEKGEEDAIRYKEQIDDLFVRVVETVKFERGAVVIDVDQLDDSVPRVGKDWYCLLPVAGSQAETPVEIGNTVGLRPEWLRDRV